MHIDYVRSLRFDTQFVIENIRMESDEAQAAAPKADLADENLGLRVAVIRLREAARDLQLSANRLADAATEIAIRLDTLEGAGRQAAIRQARQGHRWEPPDQRRHAWHQNPDAGARWLGWIAMVVVFAMILAVSFYIDARVRRG